MTKTIFIILFLFNLFSGVAQNNFRLNKYCNDPKAPFDIIVVNNKKIKYQIIGLAEMNYGKYKNQYSVECILPNYTRNSNKEELKKIMRELKKLNSKFTKFTFFDSCESYLIFINSSTPIGDRKRKLEVGYIGEFE